MSLVLFFSPHRAVGGNRRARRFGCPNAASAPDRAGWIRRAPPKVFGAGAEIHSMPRWVLVARKHAHIHRVYKKREQVPPQTYPSPASTRTHKGNTPDMEQVPQTMRALVAPKHCRPDGYEIAQLPLPELTEPNQVLIRIHAAAMQAGDCQFASGSARMFLSTRSVSTLPPDI